MRCSYAVSWLVLALCAITDAQPSAATHSVTVHLWSLDAASPQELADISYNPSTLTTTINKYNPPTKSTIAEDLVRIGLYDAATSSWRGVVTSPESFDKKYQQKLALHIDEDGEVWHVAISTYLKPVAQEQAERMPQLVVEVVKPTPGAVPFLNRPILLNAEGKIDEKEPEKTLFQKYVSPPILARVHILTCANRYWWVIGVVLFVQIMAAGGKE